MKGPERPPTMDPRAQVELDRDLDRLRAKRESSKWTLVLGIAMVFGGGFHVGLAIGGVFMTLFGGAGYLFWSDRLRRLDDPWDDPEIDAWEEEHFQAKDNE